MQARAIFEAAIEAADKTAQPVDPEIMVPLIAIRAELDMLKGVIDEVADAGVRQKGGRGRISGRDDDRVAARGAPWPGEIAEAAEFFSFGTNDLTQTTSASAATMPPRSWGNTGKGPDGPIPSSPRSEGVGELVAIARRTRTGRAHRHQARHLRRAWRRPGIHRFLRAGRARLCVLLPLSRADRTSGGGPGFARGPRREERLSKSAVRPRFSWSVRPPST